MFIPSVHPSIIHPSICIYVYVHPPVHSFLCPPSDHLSIMHPSINIHTSIHPSVIHPSSHPSSLPSLRPSVLPPICPLSVYQSTIHPCSHICSPIHSSVHPSIYHPIAGCIIHLSIIHPNIFKHPFVHLPIHSSTIQPFTCHSSSHPCIFIHLFLYLSIHPFNHSFIIHPSTHPSVRLFTRYSSSNPALSRSLFYPVPVSQYIHSHQPWSCPIPGLLVCLALSLIPSLCLPPLLLPTALLLSNPAYRLLLATYARPPRGPGPPTPAWAKPTNTQGKPLCLWAPPGSPYLYRGREKSSYLAFPPLPAVASFALLSSQGGSSNALSSPLLCLFLLKAFPLSTGAESSLVLSSVFFLLFQPIYSAL